MTANRTLGRFVAIAGASILALSAFAGAWAQSPPTPPARFAGSVTVDGQPATAGTAIEARIGSVTCGTTTVFMASGQARYVLDSPASEPSSSPNCGTEGATVTFFVAGRQASQTGSWLNYQLNELNLQVVTPTPTPTPSTPTATPTPSATPRGPDTGTGMAAADDGLRGAPWMVALAGLIGIAGATPILLRRRR